MHAFGTNDKMNKYSNVLDILKEFFSKRLELYKKRKTYQLNQLQKSIEVLEQKIRFIRNVITNQIVFKGKNKQRLVAELQQRGYKTVSGTYDYLLSQPIWNMTSEKIQTSETQLQELKQSFQYITNQTPENMWLKDLDELSSALNKQQNNKRKYSSSSTHDKKRKLYK